ncbi:MAG: hypothetical protein IPH84_05540 [Bacteroidales bacterium]|nr:hypothetical protein [Bacteroidales bacterium]
MKTSKILTIGYITENDIPVGMIGMITASPTTQTANSSFFKEEKIVIKELPVDIYAVSVTPFLPILLVTHTNAHASNRLETYVGISAL